MLTSYVTILLNSLITSYSLTVYSFRFSTYLLWHLWIMAVLFLPLHSYSFYSFLTICFLFLFSSLLICQESPVQCCLEAVIMSIFLSDLRESFQYFTFNCSVCYRLCDALCQILGFSFFPGLPSVWCFCLVLFLMNECCILTCFFFMHQMIICFSPLFC